MVTFPLLLCIFKDRWGGGGKGVWEDLFKILTQRSKTQTDFLEVEHISKEKICIYKAFVLLPTFHVPLSLRGLVIFLQDAGYFHSHFRTKAKQVKKGSMKFPTSGSYYS